MRVLKSVTAMVDSADGKTYHIVNVDLRRGRRIIPFVLLCSRQLLGLECTLVCLQHHVTVVVLVEDVEVVVVAARQDLSPVGSPEGLELVKDAVIFIQIAQLRSQVLVDGDCLDRLGVHVHVPNLERQIVTRENIPTVARELDVGNRRDDLAEE